MTDPLPPGSTIGILGGGQLGRMLALAAAPLGLKVVIFDPDEKAPAAQVSAGHVAAAYDDADALAAFAARVDVVTYEFENIPTAALDLLESKLPIRPGRQALAISQDRLSEKTWLQDQGARVAPFADIASEADLAAALEHIGAPAILKTRRFGYDGKGQVRLKGPEDVPSAWEALKGSPAVLEGFVDFDCEISVIGARGLDGSVACFDPGRNLHEDGILRRTTVPAGVPASLTTDAVLLAGRILNALDYVGVLGIEFFVTGDGLVVNEFAPRVHNSGHWTQNGCLIDQFEQHIRAVAGWPLGDGRRFADVEMQNLIGHDADNWQALGATGGLHLYGKAEARPGRKMGHVNRITGLNTGG